MAKPIPRNAFIAIIAVGGISWFFVHANNVVAKDARQDRVDRAYDRAYTDYYDAHIGEIGTRIARCAMSRAAWMENTSYHDRAMWRPVRLALMRGEKVIRRQETDFRTGKTTIDVQLADGAKASYTATREQVSGCTDSSMTMLDGMAAYEGNKAARANQSENGFPQPSSYTGAREREERRRETAFGGPH